MFPCDFENCSATFNKKWKLIEHVAKHTGEKPFACTHEGCTKAFTRQPHLQRHIKSHSSLKEFICEEVGCGGAFSSKDSLKKHTQRVHQGRLFKCEYEGCGKTFHKHQHLTVHQYIHTNIKPYKCEYEGCESSFLIPSKLKAHMKIHKGYTCSREGCTASFSKWSELTSHMAQHTTEFQCDKCNQVFNKKHKLRNHMNIHDEERTVFICPRDECDRRFLKMESLRLHISKFHEGDRPFSCSHPGCAKTFSYKKSLVQHQIVHQPNYQKPPPKPRKRRSLASRLSGHPDVPLPDILSSPLHSMTFEPEKSNEAENVNDTENESDSAEVKMESSTDNKDDPMHGMITPTTNLNEARQIEQEVGPPRTTTFDPQYTVTCDLEKMTEIESGPIDTNKDSCLIKPKTNLNEARHTKTEVSPPHTTNLDPHCTLTHDPEKVMEGQSSQTDTNRESFMITPKTNLNGARHTKKEVSQSHTTNLDPHCTLKHDPGKVMEGQSAPTNQESFMITPNTNLNEARHTEKEFSPPPSTNLNPHSTLTHDPGKVKEGQSTQIDTNQESFPSGSEKTLQELSSKAVVSSKKRSRTKKSKPNRKDLGHMMEEIDQSDRAERMLLAMQNADFSGYFMNDVDNSENMTLVEESERTPVIKDNNFIKENNFEQGIFDGEHSSNINKCRNEVGMEIDSNNSHNENNSNKAFVTV